MSLQTPTQDEFDSWRLHPVTQFVAAAYEKAAEKQRAEWQRHFDMAVIPADLTAIRLELKTREDAYRAFTETTLDDFIALADPDAAPRLAAKRPPIPWRGRTAY